jgi:ATP-binding cassette subfamily B protein/subfamily B ATP-binding cassette protein MsbA
MKLLVDYALTEEPLPEAVAWVGDLPGGQTSVGLIAWLAVAMVIIFAGVRLVAGVKAYLQVGVGEAMTYDLAGDAFFRLQHQSLTRWSERPTGDLIARVTSDAACVSDLVLGVAMPAFTSAISLVAMFVVMWLLDPRLAVIALVVAVPVPLLMRAFARPMNERALHLANTEAKLMTHSEQTLVALADVKAFTREQREDAQFRSLSRLTISAGLRTQAAELAYGISNTAVTALGLATIMFVGGLDVVAGSLTIGALLVFLAYLPSLYGPLESLAPLVSSYAAAKAKASRVLEVLEVEGEVRDPDHPKRLPVGRRGGVCFDGVTFGYESEFPVLTDIRLEARPGDTIALVGRTGSGKTTLVSLIPRFFDPWQGSINLDGIDLRDLRVKELRRNVALVRQEPLLLPITVADNIAYGRPEASPVEIEAAAVAANADEFIRRLPDGYDTVLGERGDTLSGGQRQRLAIARALLKDAPVLILDEPSSALDAETEHLLLEALERLMEGRTTFVIAHRLSTVRRADRIIVLDQGRIVETGTHHQLLQTQGLYHHLHNLQFAGAGQ